MSDNKTTYAMVIDLRRCIGCQACTVACKAEHASPPGIFRCRVMRKEVGTYPETKRISLPMLCMHCADPACVRVCPTGASRRRPDGIITIENNECIGCRACATACPYSARTFHEREEGYFTGKELTPFERVGYRKHPTGVMEKCDFCLERVERGLEPACVQTCVTRARTFGKAEEMREFMLTRSGFQLRPELRTDPSVYYLPWEVSEK